MSPPGRGVCYPAAGAVDRLKLSRFLGRVPAADASRAKQLREREARDERAAADAGREEDKFFGDSLHSNSCDGGDGSGSDLSPVWLRCGYRLGRLGRLDVRRALDMPFEPPHISHPL